MQLFAGELTAAASLTEEVQAATEATGGNLAPYVALGLAAWHGREDEASALIEAARGEVSLRGEGIGITVIEWSNAVLYNGLSRYDEALAAAEQGSRYPHELGLATWSMAELIEAAARTGQPGHAAGALRSLSETTSAAGTDWALGVEARSRALLSEGESAAHLYRQAIEHLSRTRVRAELARTHLLYGEWLRRRNRRVDATEQLRVAYQMLTAMGAEGFAERARRELLATGETVHKRTAGTAGGLTAQEAQIARLARDGLSNLEIGGRMFLSPRTVEWHLRKVFVKLGITSRRQLRGVLPGADRAALPVSRAVRQPGADPAVPGRLLGRLAGAGSCVPASWRRPLRVHFRRLIAGLRYGAVNSRIHAHIVKRARGDCRRNCASLGAAADRPVVIASLPGGDGADDQPNDKKHRSNVHADLRQGIYVRIRTRVAIIAWPRFIPASTLRIPGYGDAVSGTQGARAFFQNSGS